MSTYKSLLSFNSSAWYGARKKAKFLAGDSKYSLPSIWYFPIFSFTLTRNSSSTDSCRFSYSFLKSSNSSTCTRGMIFGLSLDLPSSTICLSLLILLGFDAAGDFSAGMKPMPWPFWSCFVVREQSFVTAVWMSSFTACDMTWGAGFVWLWVVPGRHPIHLLPSSSTGHT